jgi:hypothetical protein
VLSLAVLPKWVTLCFIQNGPKLRDPKRLLKGSGTVVRNIRLQSPRDLDDPDIRAIIDDALTRAKVAIDPAGRRRMIIKSISAKQRPDGPGSGRRQQRPSAGRLTQSRRYSGRSVTAPGGEKPCALTCRLASSLASC